MRRLLSLFLLVPGSLLAQSRPLPILDMHLHAGPADAQGPPPVAICTFESWPVSDPRELDKYGGRWARGEWCKQPIWSAADDQTLMKQTLEALERRNIFAVASGPPDHVKRWQKAAPQRIIPALLFALSPQTPPATALRASFQNRDFIVLGEVINQYFGIAPDDPRFEPYLAMAEELDVPVAIHVGPGPPGTPYLFPMFKDYRAALHSPLTLEPVLRRHPRLRIYVAHAGWPMLDDMITMLYTYPQLYVDIAVLNHAYPPEEFYRYLKGLVTAGFAKRILFGSDQMVWPSAIDVAIERLEAAPFLSAEQKRDIFYNNAARFLRLSEEEIRRHHAEAVSSSSAEPPATQPSVPLPPALDRVLRDYERAWQARDAAALAALFTEDGFVLANGRPPARGREAIRAAYADSGGPLSLRAFSYAMDGSTGYIIGGYGSEPRSEDTGKFVLALRRESGERWLIAADIDNSNRRPFSAPAAAGARRHDAAIRDVILSVARAADLRLWDLVRAAFAPRVLLDYGAPEQITPEEIVSRWRPLLSAFDWTQHEISGIRVNLTGDRARVESRFTATHFFKGVPGGDTWVLQGRYEHELVNSPAGWKITGMRMIPFESSGNPKLLDEAKDRAAAGRS